MDKVNDGVILVDLDALLDTRLAVYKAWLGDVTPILDAGYVTRTHDRLDGVDYDEYLKRYADRDREILIYAGVTSIPRVISNYVTVVRQSSADTPNPIYPTVSINTWPYKLSTKEENLIVEGLLTHTKTLMATVSCISIPPDQITPRYLKQHNVISYITYSGEEWLGRGITSGIFLHQSCPAVILTMPDILTQDKKLYEEQQISTPGASPLQLMVEIMKPIIAVEPIATVHYVNRLLVT